MIAKEMVWYDIYIVALSETRLNGEDQLTESGFGYAFFCKGNPKSEKHECVCVWGG